MYKMLERCCRFGENLSFSSLPFTLMTGIHGLCPADLWCFGVVEETIYRSSPSIISEKAGAVSVSGVTWIEDQDTMGFPDASSSSPCPELTREGLPCNVRYLCMPLVFHSECQPLPTSVRTQNVRNRHPEFSARVLHDLHA